MLNSTSYWNNSIRRALSWWGEKRKINEDLRKISEWKRPKTGKEREKLWRTCLVKTIDGSCTVYTLFKMYAWCVLCISFARRKRAPNHTWKFRKNERFRWICSSFMNIKCAFCNEHRAFCSRFCEENSTLRIRMTMYACGSHTEIYVIVFVTLCRFSRFCPLNSLSRYHHMMCQSKWIGL